MALAPISQFSLSFVSTYAGYWIKGYQQGSTTPLAMFTDSGGLTSVAKAEISSGGTVPIGFIKTAGDAIFIPYYEAAYDLFLFPTEAEADANDFSNSIQIADNFFLDTYVKALIDQTASIVTDYAGLRAIDSTVLSQGARTAVSADRIGGSFWLDLTDTTSPDDGGTLIVATDGARWKRAYGNEVVLDWFNLDNTGVADVSTSFDAIRIAHGSVLATSGTYRVIDETDSSFVYGGANILRNGETAASALILTNRGKTTAAPVIFDMHFGPIKGVAWDDNGGLTAYVLASNAVEGATTITFTGTVPPDDTMLSVLADDGTWYSIAIGTATGQIMALREPLEADITAGTTITNFYSDVAHPNANGFKVIMDAALRSTKESRQLLNRLIPVEFGASVTLASILTESSYLPGSDNLAAYQFTTINPGTGVFVQFRPARGVRMMAKIKLNTGGQDMEVKVIEGENKVITSTSVNKTTASFIEVPITVSLAEKTQVKIAITGVAGLTSNATVSTVDIYEIVGEKVGVESNQTHVFIGDSWFDSAYDMVDRFRERNPTATIINQGVGSQTSVDILARFVTDVIDEDPNYVWINAGTNDLYAGTTVDDFSYNIQRMIDLSVEAGITPIVLTAAVGEQPGSVAEWFALSREYQESAAYFYASDDNMEFIRFAFNADNAQSLRIVNLGLRPDGFAILESFVSSADSFTIDIGATPSTLFSNIGSIAAGHVTAPTYFSYDGNFYAGLAVTTTSANIIDGYIKVFKQ